MRPFLFAAVALLAVGIANIDVHPTETKVVRTPAPPAKVVTKVKTVKVRDNTAPDGYMTTAACNTLMKSKGVTNRQVIAQYGWPAGRDGDDSDGTTLYYPLTEDHGSLCQIGFYDGVLDDVDIEEDWL